MPRFDRVFRNISSLRAKLARGRKGGNHIEINRGYEILKSVTFDNGRGFALGYDEAAPSPFVTWQFTETENGQRDYYWGHYHSDGQTAEKDFAKRIDDYKELFQVQEHTGGREPAAYYRYYSTQRPVDLGTFPKPPGNAPVEIINFDERRMVEGGTIRAWGELAYLKPLTEKQMEDYELRPAPGNPDRAARPSITAQLKEAAHRSEATKEPEKIKHNKSHEDR